jgi:hypothetical protein
VWRDTGEGAAKRAVERGDGVHSEHSVERGGDARGQLGGR